MTNQNKQRIVNAIWENPTKVFGCPFRTTGKFQENKAGGEYQETGKIRICLTSSGENIMVFYNGSSREEKCDVFTYLGDYVFRTHDFRETLERCAAEYCIQLEYSEHQLELVNRERLARIVCESLLESLRKNPTGETATYLREVREMEPTGKYFGELSEAALTRINDVLALKNQRATHADLTALGLTHERVKEGYKLVMPYYRNGIVRGFVFRNIRKDCEPKDRYRYSKDLGRGGYCDFLSIGDPVTIVEGQFDAIRLMQAGVNNVVAIGGAKIGEDIAKLLAARNISAVTYVPDLEFDEKGVQKTKLIDEAIKGFLSVKVDGEPVIKNLYIAELSAPQGANLNGLKIDADEYGKINGNAMLVESINTPVVSWDYELQRLRNEAYKIEQRDGSINIAWFQREFDAIYNRYANPYERQRIKEYINSDEAKQTFEPFGVTVEALTDIDDNARNREYVNRVAQCATELDDAIKKGANPVRIAEISAQLVAAQGSNTREEWDRQLNESYDDELQAIANQPETLKSRWELGNIAKGGKYVKYTNIEYYPADLSVFCASTSHGKTMFLMQSALDMVRDNPDKTFLYVSCEEYKPQLTERALNVYLDIPTTASGREKDVMPSDTPFTNPYCFIEQTRKRAIKTTIKGYKLCEGYPTQLGGMFAKSEHFEALSKRIDEGIKEYGRVVRPRLKFIHTDATAESITANLLYFVEKYRNEGKTIGAIFLDYMQLLNSETKHFSRTDELKDVCKALKRVAVSLEIPLVIGAQLNRSSIKDGIDDITVANLGESADIERIAHDLYFIWQIDKTKRDNYFKIGEKTKEVEGKNGKIERKKTGEQVEIWDYSKQGDRSNRIFTRTDEHSVFYSQRELKTGYMYVEQLKARDGKSSGWGLFPFDGERGHIGAIDTAAMAK